MFKHRRGDDLESCQQFKFQELKKQNVTVVESDVEGLHVLIVAIDQDSKKCFLYYLNQENLNLQVIKSLGIGEAITALAVVNVEDTSGVPVFEIAAGTRLGVIYHGKFSLDSIQGARVEEPFKHMLDFASGEQIFDLKIVKGDKRGVLATTEHTFHQFWGNTRNSVGEILHQSEINADSARA